jgi:predicted nucleic acid-binding protein
VTALSDSSAWYALLSSSDSQHVSARRRFGRLVAEGRTVVATNHVISETYTLLRGRLGSRPALSFLEQARADPFVRRVQVPGEWEAEAELLLTQYSDQRFSYVDATSFITMRHLGLWEALTFDSDFLIAGFSLVGDQ